MGDINGEHLKNSKILGQVAFSLSTKKYLH